MVVVLVLEKNIAAWGQGLAEISLPSNHCAEIDVGALWGSQGMHLLLALEDKQMTMLILDTAGIL